MKEWKKKTKDKKKKEKEKKTRSPCPVLPFAPLPKTRTRTKNKKKSLEIHLFPLYLVSFPLFPPSLTLLFLPIQPFYVPPTIILNNLGVVLATNPL